MVIMFFSVISLAWYQLVLVSAFNTQATFSRPSADFGFKYAPYDGVVQSIEDISVLPATEHTVVSHPAYTNYRVRIKQNGGSFCDNTVRSYTGYLDFGARHLFFYFFESRNDPKKDDVILWTNGGPGCSSSLGLFMELGPCLIKDDNSTTFNPHSWNSKANIILIDQPVGVGFSYADYGELVASTEEAAQDVSAFTRIFFDTFTEFKGRTFHLASEAYGGRYIPTFGAKIYDDNKKAVAAGLAPVSLTSLIIGNGLIDSFHVAPTMYDIQCTGASIEPFQDIAKCVQMKKAIPRCQKMLKETCIDVYDEMSCRAANSFCESAMLLPFMETGRNFYDVSKPCEGGYNFESLCYAITSSVTVFLNKPEIRASLGVDSDVLKFTPCSTQVTTAFEQGLDTWSHSAKDYIVELLERGVKVLIFVGTYDLVCNWIGAERFTSGLEWTGQKEFVSQNLEEWRVNGEVVGQTRSARGFTYATIHGGGHMTTRDKPAEVLEMLTRWLDRRSL